MGARHRAREFSLKVLYQIDICNMKEVEDAIRRGKELINHRGVDMDYSQRLIHGVIENIDQIDRIISEVSEHWSLERMDRVDKGILRIALFELLWCDDVPYKVSINEAIELGKSFGTEDSAAFINGILDSVAKRFVKKPPARRMDDKS